MAETLTIEIPIEAVDRTGAGVQSATRNLTAFERAWDRTQRRLDRLERAHNIDIELDDNASQGLSRVSDQAESLDGVSPSVDVGVNNAATGTLSDVADQAATLDGTASDVEVGADNNATGIIDDVGDSLTALNGNEAVVGLSADDSATMEIRDAGDALASLDGDVATVELTADDNATQAIRAAEDAAEMLDGTSATAELGADDNATPIVRAAEDAVENFSGSSGSAQLGADDNASPVIDSVRDKAAAWDGSVWTATVSVVDAATAPLTAIMNAAKNPLTQAGAALGISVGLGDTVNTYKNFESMMSQVGAISGATGQAFEDLTAKAQEMGATTKFTATEAAEAFNYMAMAGWEPEQMTAGISGIMNLAAASGEDLASTSDIVTDALTAFGLKARDSGHFADVLAKASASANTNVGMLGESFKYVAPVAGAMKYSVEDTSLALGLMANSSIKGSMAGTALKTSLANMAAPTDSMAAAMKEYGISLTDSSGNMKTLKGVMDNLRGSLGGLSETEQTAAASTIFGKEAMAGMLAIINASEEDYNKLSEAIYNSKDAAQDMADTMLDNLDGSMTLMQSAVEGVQNSFGKRLTPYIRGVVDAITDATPAATAALTNLMDFVDGKAEGIKRTVSGMTNSQEWQNADLFGKVDIAWDTLIAEPFTKWAGSKGKHLLSKGLSSLFGEAAKIMPGGEQAGLTSWLSAGLIAKGATSLIGNAGNVVRALSPIGSAIKNIGLAAQTAPSVGAFVSDLGGMIPTAAKFGIAAAAITAAVVAIGVAIDNYNEKQISKAEWAAIMLWCKKNGFQPYGNNNYGKDSRETLQQAIPATYGSGTDAGKIYHVLTGTGPLTWSHNKQLDGIWDLNGNVSEWTGALRTVKGELQLLENNNGANSDNPQTAASSAWKAIDATTGAFITPDGNGTTANSIKIDATGAGGAQWCKTITKTSENFSCALGALTCSADISDAAKAVLRAYGLLPVDGAKASDYDDDRLWFNNVADERLFHSGGYYGYGTSAGVGFSNGDWTNRGSVVVGVGFRSAFADLESVGL